MELFRTRVIDFLLERLSAEILMIVLIMLICDCRQNCRNQGTVLDSMVIA